MPAAPDDRLAAQLRGFGPLGLIAILIIAVSGNISVGNVAGMPILVPAGAVLVLLWRHLSRTPWREIGYARPASWIGSLAIGIVLGIALKFLMKAVVMPLFRADPINHSYHFLAGNRTALPAAVWVMIVAAGFGEETVFRGYLFERLGKLLGSSSGAKALIVLITAVWFGLAHYLGQGLAGVEQATVVGLVYGTIFALTGQIFLLMCAHAAFDLTAVAMIYWDLESRVAHWVFR